jgi:hypothetical protein
MSQQELMGRRNYIIDIVDEVGFPYNTRRGATHPYGIGQDEQGNVYVSFQDTDSVLRFSYDPSAPRVTYYTKQDLLTGSFVPIESPSGLPLLKKDDYSYFNGTFVQFGTPSDIGSTGDMGIRSILFVEKNLWVANEDLDGIVIVNPEGVYVGFVSVKSPIGKRPLSDSDTLPPVVVI